MLLYSCQTAGEVEALTPYKDHPNEEGGMPCNTVKYAWAVGAKDFCKVVVFE
jgi:hypothetical protein